MRGFFALAGIWFVLLLQVVPPVAADELDANLANLKTLCDTIKASPAFALDGLKTMADMLFTPYDRALSSAQTDARIAKREYDRLKALGFKSPEWQALEGQMRKIMSDGEAQKASERAIIVSNQTDYTRINTELATLTTTLTSRRQELQSLRGMGSGADKLTQFEAEIAGLEKQMATLWKDKATTATVIGDSQRKIAQIDGKTQATLQPLFAQQDALKAEAEKRIDAAREKFNAAGKAESDALLARTAAEAAKMGVHGCIQARRKELERADAKPADTKPPVDYAGIDKLGQDFQGGGGGDKTAGSQGGAGAAPGRQPESYAGGGSGVGGLVGKIPVPAFGSGMLTPPPPTKPVDSKSLIPPPSAGNKPSSSAAAAPAPSPASPPPPAPKWIVWEAGFSIGIHVSTEEEFKSTVPVKYAGGGPTATVVKRNQLLGPFDSQSDSCKAVKAQLTDVSTRPLGVGLVGKFGGKDYYIGSMGCGG